MADKILVLIDMNGVVCYREEVPVPGVRADLYIRRKYYYTRHGVEDFVQRLVKSGYFDVVVYSSMMLHNIEAGLNAVMPRARRLLRDVLDRAMNKPDPEGAEEWDTIRDMQKVWRRLPEYGPENTILLDNEARKFKEHPENGIVVPEFGPTEVRTRRAGTLNSLLEYLLELGRAAPDDVRDYLHDYPFGGPSTGITAVAAATPAPGPAAVKASAAAGAGNGASAGPLTARPSSDSASTDLADALSQLSVGASSAAATLQRAAAASSTSASSNFSSYTAGTGAAATRADADGSTEAELHIAPGTRLHLVCIDSHEFVMSGTSRGSPFKVRGPVTRGMRVTPRMDYHLLQDEAREYGCKLTVERG